MLKLCKSFFGFFKPRRAEFLLILISLLLLAAVILPEFITMSLPYSLSRERNLWNFSLLLVLGVSIGAGLGTFRWNELIRDLWFAISVVLILFYCGFLLYRENLLFRGLNYQQSLNFAVNPQAIPWVLEGWLLCLLGTFGAGAITKSVFVAFDAVSRKFNLATLTRQRLMVGIAVVLFISLMTRNILDKSGVRLGEFNWNFDPAIQFLIGVGVVLVGAALPAWAISKIRGGWALVILMVYLGTITGLSASFVSMPIQFLIGFYALVFSCVVVAMTSYRGLYDADDVPEKVRGFWGIGTLSIALLATLFFWNLSLNALLFGGSTRIELARQLKIFSSENGVESQFMIWNPGLFRPGSAQIYSEIEFHPNADRTCLKIFANSPNQFGFNLTNVSPAIETSHVNNISKFDSSISNSRITFQQLEDVVNTAVSFTITDCQFESSTEANDSKETILIGFPTVQRFYLRNMPADETGKFLQQIDENQFAGRVYVGIDGKLSEWDWRQIIDRSQHLPISAYQRPPQNVIDQAIKHDLPADLFLRGFSTLDRDYWNLIVNTQFSVEVKTPNSNDEVEKFWDAAFASRGTNWADAVFRQMQAPRFDADLLETAKLHHWVFEEDELGEPTGALMPFGSVHIDRVSTWNALTSLSLDARWIESLGNYDDRKVPVPTDISALGNLTKLKRLDLPSGLWGADYAFLNKLPELEHLQFDVFVNGSKNVDFGFLAADCPNLKSLVLFGRPHKALALEIAKLPKLESVKLIDIDETLMKAGQREMIQKTLGENISLTIVPLKQDRPHVPAEFVEHVKQIRGVVRKKYLSGDGTKSIE